MIKNVYVDRSSQIDATAVSEVLINIFFMYVYSSNSLKFLIDIIFRPKLDKKPKYGPQKLVSVGQYYLFIHLIICMKIYYFSNILQILKLAFKN